MPDAKPLSAEKLADYVKDASENCDCSRCKLKREFLATIRRRDELIRWLVRYHGLESSLISVYHTTLDVMKDDRKTATEILEIVEAGDE